MRIISGTAKGKKLSEFKGKNIRPTSDRVREAIFSSLYSRLGEFKGLKILDIFAGTGAMGIEALSRGADSAIFIDQSREAVDLISKNLNSVGLEEKGAVLSGNVRDILPQLAAREIQFDLIFIDPPYADKTMEELLLSVNNFGLLQSDGIMSFETSRETVLPEKAGMMRQIDRRLYGATAVNYYQVVATGESTDE